LICEFVQLFDPSYVAERGVTIDLVARLAKIKPCSRLSQMPHRRHIKEERKEIRNGNFSLDGSSHQTGDAAFIPATPNDLRHSRANTSSNNSPNTQHTSVKQNKLRFMQKGTQPSQACSGEHITPNPTRKRRSETLSYNRGYNQGVDGIEGRGIGAIGGGPLRQRGRCRENALVWF
jgi:hypothetical protein